MLNLVSLLFFVGDWAYFSAKDGLHPRMRITMLDREGVINEDRLKESFPEFTNIRSQLGPWVAGDVSRSAHRAFLAGSGMAAANVVLLSLLLFFNMGSGRRRDEREPAK